MVVVVVMVVGMIVVVVPVAVVMAMVVVMIMIMPVPVPVPVGPVVVVVRLARHLAVAASANRAHHAISMSLIRISSPETGMSRPPPQSGQGSSRFPISTVPPQS